jgi:hypothetical protein
MDEAIAKYLKENLTIEIRQNTEFGPNEIITVELRLNGELISDDWCSLPSSGD